MTTNIDRAAEVLWLPEPHLFTSECDDQARELAQALADAGLLMPDQTIIRTVEELEALDPDTLLHASERDYYAHAWGFNHYRLPAVLVATADQVRAARKALEES